MAKNNVKNSAGYSNWLKNDLSKLTSQVVNNSIDYRHIPLYPTLDDIINKSPSLTANNVKRPYQNCDIYLDTFFRLMREDFVSTIRDNLRFMKKTHKNNHEQLEMHRMWYFKNVNIQKSNGKALKTITIRFDSLANAKYKDYENSKQFKNGSLLLLSKDKFDTFCLGIVVETFSLNKGIVGVDVIDYKEVINWTCVDLFEPSTFYEPYRYVMGVLQDMNETNFPMKNYIVYGIKNVNFPSYLEKNPMYTINGIQFNVLQNNQWPSAEVLKMDTNQYEAFKGALTKEFTMIQGPPGTGKTYIGLEIVKTIIENLYETKKITNPIMIVCMTNHALDQFLEGIWRITRNIARFGCGTKSDILVNFIPKMSFASKVVEKSLFKDVQHDVKKYFQKESLHLNNIKEVTKNKGVLNLSLLREVLLSRGVNQWFNDSYDYLKWLFFGISYIDDTHPIDFLKKKGLLASWTTKKNHGQKKEVVYCITLQNIDQYLNQINSQLIKLNKSFNPEDNNDVLKIKDLKFALKIAKTVKNYVVKNLKLNKSDYCDKFNNNIERDSLEDKKRWMLYYSWVNEFIKLEKINVDNLKEITYQGRRDVNKFKSIGYLKPVKNKFVIGMTTTAAARNRYLLKNLKCPIVIIEEAAEVLEPHIVASLSEYCQHLILIGDHKQLRPCTASHIMAKKYQLDVSLFERMVNNEIPSYVLAEQHRMRPEIAGLVAPAIYPFLKNHSSVEGRPHVRGVGIDVFCISHNVQESKNYELVSFINENEAKFLVALADYLYKQGYNIQDITIMAMYNAQVLYITELTKSPSFEHLKDIRITSVDGYQGEENEIVLLSLVRSNNQNSIGFLKTDNRVCVALSRARLGFYIAGNLNLLANASNLWKSVKHYLCDLNALGPKLTLKCPIHHNVFGSVSTDSDFKQLSGCKAKCNIKLSCGHLCKKECHFKDREHTQVNCLRECEKKCLRGHKCRKFCYENCSKCEVSVSLVGDCGHPLQGKCSDIESMKCQIKEEMTLNCGHLLEKICYEPSFCNKKCNQPNLNCLFKHLCQKPCGVACGPCMMPIQSILPCNHISEILCYESPDSVECTARVNRTLSCGHQVDVLCGSDEQVLCDQLIITNYTYYCKHTGPMIVPCYLTMNESLQSSLKKWCKKQYSFKLECGHWSQLKCDACKIDEMGICHKCINKGKRLNKRKKLEE